MSEARRTATYEDLQRLPDTVVGEIVDGELYASPRPALRYADAGSGILTDIRSIFGRRRGGRGPGGWVILVEPELHLGPDIVVPDIAGWRRERLSEPPDAAYLSLAPDWMCEVLSPSTARLDRFRKLPVYARACVGHAWIVDPLARTQEVYRLHDEHWLLVSVHGGDEPLRAEPFDEVELDPTEWWGGPETPEPTAP